MKFIKVTCSSSNITCKNLTCYVKPISRVEGAFSLQCNLEKPLRNLLVSFSVNHKAPLSRNFNHLYTYRNLRICDVKKLCNMFPILDHFIKFANATIFNGALKQKCPYGPGIIQIVNATINPPARWQFDRLQSFPNGVYRTDFKVYNNLDDNILSFSTFARCRWRALILNNFEKF